MRGRAASLASWALPALVVLLVYAPALGAALVWDDHVLLGPRLAERGVASLFTRPFFTASALHDAAPVYYRPLVLASFRLDVALFGPGARVHHAVNVALHAVNVALLATWARRLGAHALVAGALALAWGLLPRLSEAVVWVSGRTDVLALALSLTAVIAMPGKVRGPSPRLGLALLALLAALLSKETSLAFAVAVAAGSRARARWVAAPVGVWLALRTLTLWDTHGEGRSLGLAARAVTSLEACGRYVAMTFDAWRSASSVGLVGAPSVAHVAVGAAAVGAAALAAWRWRARGAVDGDPEGRWLPWAVGALAIAPALHVLPIGLAGAVTADRLLYVPLAAIAVGLATCPGLGARREPASAAGPTPRGVWVTALIALVAAASFAGPLRARVADYDDEVRFWVAAAERAHPGNAAPLASLAEAVRERGRVELACRVLADARRVLEQGGRSGSARHRRVLENLGGCLAARGDYAAAATAYETAADGAGATARVRLGLGYVRMHALDLDGAERDLRQAQREDPRLTAAAGRALDAIALGRRELASWPPERRAAKPAGWAPVAAALGRVPDVERGYLAVAEDPARAPAERAFAAHELTRLGLVDAAARAAKALDVGGIAESADARTDRAALERRAREVDAQAPRIEALLTR
ncbi:MAG: hypothetical protein KC657_32960 [Myxococcales bacterium]|nr:hypothetical protein [Myxococcales bacterium]